MKIEDVLLFERIAALNSISAGGAACDLSATVSSDRLKRLETDLGCTLLNRTTRSMSLTDQGTRFLEHAKDLLANYEAARNSVGRRSDMPTGLLRVAAPSLFGKKFPARSNKLVPDGLPGDSAESEHVGRNPELHD